jgi:hypothetical protein
MGRPSPPGPEDLDAETKQDKGRKSGDASDSFFAEARESSLAAASVPSLM